jgi:magnesium-protoporphyrin O-methyltransferase
MMALADSWLVEALQAGGLNEGAYVLDAGCGTGLFSIALARRGFNVTAVDIAPQMVGAAMRQARVAGVQKRIAFVVNDLEAVGGSYGAVVCLDVLIHYPQPSFEQLCRRLAQLSSGPLLFTYAPREPLLAALHWIGGRFPKSQRRTDIQMIPYRVVHQALEAIGMRVHRRVRISRGFYQVSLVEAWPASS